MNINIVQEQLLNLLEGKNAHITFQKTVTDFPIDRINSLVAGVPYSPYELLEHLRITQHDILDFIINPNYKEPKWPDDYWPVKGRKVSEKDWQESIQGFLTDLESLKNIVLDPQTDFTEPLIHGPKYNIFREILIVGNHNSYHIGQLLLLKRIFSI